MPIRCGASVHCTVAHRNAAQVENFGNQLKENGAELPTSFLHSLHKAVLAATPQKSTQQQQQADSKQEQKQHKRAAATEPVRVTGPTLSSAEPAFAPTRGHKDAWQDATVFRGLAVENSAILDMDELILQVSLPVRLLSSLTRRCQVLLVVNLV